MSLADVALAAAAGGLLCVERKALGQLMLARPLVVAPIVAAILGDAHTGLAVGIPLELYFLGSASYGATTPDHESLAALFAAALAAAAAPTAAPAPASALAVAVFLALPFAAIGRRVEGALERRNELYVARAEDFLALGKLALATRQGLAGLAGTFGVGFCVTLAGALLALPVARLEAILPARVESGLALAWHLVVGLCAAQAVRAIQTPGAGLLSGIAAVTVFVVFALSALIGS